MMMKSPVGICADYINTKCNKIADYVSRIKSKTQSMVKFDKLLQEFPQLKVCRRFQPSNELISYILDALLYKKSIDPVALSQLLLKNPGRIIS